MPFIPNRAKHGYGLSMAGLKEVIKTYNPKLIITVDNGVTAISETKWAQKQGIKIIIIDHHELTKKYIRPMLWSIQPSWLLPAYHGCSPIT